MNASHQWSATISDRFTKLLILMGVLAILIGLPVVALLWMTSVPGSSYTGPLPAATATEADLTVRLRHHVEAIADQPHNLADPETLDRTANYIEETLGTFGYPVERQFFQVEDKQARNIEVVVEPRDRRARTLVIGAHYDSHAGTPGANDNGSGTAGVIELARLLANLDGKSALRIRLVLFANEEPPFFKTEQMGSLVYARALNKSGEDVLGMMALETMGFYSDALQSQHYPPLLGWLYPDIGNFIAFVGLTSSRGWVRQSIKAFRDEAEFPSVGGTAPGFIQGIDWSDHWAFEQVGIPALMITDTAPFRYPYYHSPADTPDKVNYDRLARVIGGLEKMVRRWGLNDAGPTRD